MAGIARRGSPESSTNRPRHPRRGAYLLPSLFTVANAFCGFFAVTESFRAGQLIPGDLQSAAMHFDYAARAIGWAVLFDGMDGRIARLMGTSSEFGKQLDSIADAITFGAAPALLAFAWGVRAVIPIPETAFLEHLTRAGWLVSFLFMILSAMRLARFNLQSTSAMAAERPEHKNFVGLPTPASAGLVAAIVHFNAGSPLADWGWVPFWLLLLLGTSFLMISTWRYTSFKELDLRRKRKFAVVIGVASIVALIWLYSQIALLVLAVSYFLSGIVVKLLGVLRRGRVGIPAKERHV